MPGLGIFNFAVVLLVVAVVGHDPHSFLAAAQPRDYPLTCWGPTQQPANLSFAAVWSNNQAFCGLHGDRSSACWGVNTYGQVSPTPALPPPNYFASFGMGAYHACAVVDNGTAVCWGNNSFGETTPPADAGNFTVVVSGAYSSCGLLANQSVVCWGKCASPAGDLQFAQLSHLAQHPCGVLANGTAICWCDNSYNSSVVPEGLLFKQVGVGNAYTCGLLTNGTAICWGLSQSGQGNVPKGEIFESIHVGWSHACGLRSNNSIRCWGLDSGGVVSGPNSQPTLIYDEVVLNVADTCGLLLPPSPTPSPSPARLVSNATIGQSMPQLQFEIGQPNVTITPTGTPTICSLLAFPFNARTLTFVTRR